MAKKPMLTADMSVEDALKLVKDGKVPMEAYLEWDAARVRSTSRSNGDAQISKADFKEHAKPVELVVDGQKMSLDAREFSTGSLGWGYHGKLTIQINGKPVKVQASINLMVVGSKNAK